MPEIARRRVNDEANVKLTANIRKRGLSFCPASGGGQERDDQGNLKLPQKENNFVVQPIGQMSDDEFRNHVKELLFNPTAEGGNGPFAHSQWGATVKLPSNVKAFLLHLPVGQAIATGPQDYSVETQIGDTAEPRQATDRFYTQMRYGPRATPGMTDPFDRPDDVGNTRGQPGQRFTIKDRAQP